MRFDKEAEVTLRWARVSIKVPFAQIKRSCFFLIGNIAFEEGMKVRLFLGMLNRKSIPKMNHAFIKTLNIYSIASEC